MRALVTGAAGFVGSRVAHAMLHAGYEVDAVVRTGAGERLEPIAGEIRLVRCDLTDRQEVEAMVARVQPDVCIHCAWYAVPGAYLQAEANVRHQVAAIGLAETLAAQGCARLVGVGTCLEYAFGDNPLAETSPVAPLSPYAQSKLSTFRSLEELCEVAGMGFAWARLFYLYGPYEDRRRLVPSVTLALLGGRPAQTTSGEQRRDFLHVDDVANALLAIAASDLSGAVNVGSGEATPVREVVLRLGRLAGHPELLEFGTLEPNPDDPPIVVSDSSKLRGAGWSQRLSLAEGLAATVAWWAERSR